MSVLGASRESWIHKHKRRGGDGLGFDSAQQALLPLVVSGTRSPTTRLKDTQMLPDLLHKWRGLAFKLKSLIVVGVAFLAFEFLNFTGFCYRDLRYLSDSEFHDIAIAHALRYQDARLESAGVPKERREIYSSIADFKERNPNCCHVYRWGHVRLQKPIWLLRLFGEYKAVVQIWYKLTNGEKEDFHDYYIFIRSCGEITGTTGMLTKAGPTKPRPST
jgi:hypothetical protein